MCYLKDLVWAKPQVDPWMSYLPVRVFCRLQFKKKIKIKKGISSWENESTYHLYHKVSVNAMTSGICL